MTVPKTVALPLGYSPIIVEGEGFEPTNPKERIYSPLRLATSLSLHESDPYGIRTRDTAVKGRCLNHLTKGPYFFRTQVVLYNLIYKKSTRNLSFLYKEVLDQAKL